jgi:hypothetical protein
MIQAVENANGQSFGEPQVVRFYNKRRTAEQWIKEGKQEVYHIN